MRQYINYDLVKQYPNKYNLAPKSIKKLKIADWDRLKKEHGITALCCLEV